jgi:DNA ligase D-like protein (predicted 3'-phosphoesterase)
MDSGRKDRLAEYRRKRRFDRTAEPGGDDSDQAGEGAAGERPVFVVQLHQARNLHFDFRLEADGVLKSWAVPKGPSMDPHVKRLATPTEDHPMDYRSFEGVIGEGEYGGGTVMVWDEGTFRNLTTDRSGGQVPFADALERGHASFWLDGHKLRGAYALTRIRSRDRTEAWLLVKKSDRHARAHRDADPRRMRSALSGRTLRRIAADGRKAAEATGAGDAADAAGAQPAHAAHAVHATAGGR